MARTAMTTRNRATIFIIILQAKPRVGRAFLYLVRHVIEHLGPEPRQNRFLDAVGPEFHFIAK